MGFTHDQAAGRESGPAAKALHLMLPGIVAASAEANTIIRRGPGQQPERITGELTITTALDTSPRNVAPTRRSGAFIHVRWIAAALHRHPTRYSYSRKILLVLYFQYRLGTGTGS